ncbi:MHYT domain-containing protein [Streptomyces griseus]
MTPVTYDLQQTVLSLVVAIVVVGLGVFVVGYRGGRPARLCWWRG